MVFTPLSILLLFLPPVFFYLFRFSFNEEVLLLLASLLFFGFFWSKAQLAASAFFASKIEEVYSGFAEVLLLKLDRLLLLLRFLQKSIYLSALVALVFPLLFLTLSGVRSSELELGELHLRLLVKKRVLSSVLSGERAGGLVLTYLGGVLSDRFRNSTSTEFRLGGAVA